MTLSAMDVIKNRHSVRTFKTDGIKSADMEKLKYFIQSCESPFGLKTEFKILDAAENKLSSPVVVGANLYLCAKIRRTENYEISLGYVFEEVCLFAHSLGLGTVILASTIKRKDFEKCMDLKEDEVMPVVSPLGYPAEKKSVRESLMRKSMKADFRLPFDELFFNKTYGKPLIMDDAGLFKEPFEALRLSPSATNKQPWRCVLDGDTVHFYEKKTIKETLIGDIQKVDMGICLCHFNLTAKEKGLQGEFLVSNPGIEIPENVEYIMSFKVSERLTETAK